MRYYVSKAGGQPKEISQQQFYNMIRRKDAREKSWYNDGIKVARQVILTTY